MIYLIENPRAKIYYEIFNYKQTSCKKIIIRMEI